MSFLKHIRNSLGFDYRSLALYRFLIGIIIMTDVIYRLPDITNFYTDVGLVPRALFLNEMTLPWSFSLHLANGSSEIMTIFFMIQLLLGFMVAVGYKTNWAMLGSFILNVSVHNRNWLVQNGGDDVLRSILLLSVFLPLNRFFSVDSALKKDKAPTPEDPHMSFWVMAFTFQVFAIYFISYVLKTHDMWRKDFTAIYFSSRLDIFATSFGIFTRNFQLFQKIATAATALLEWLGPLLLVFPWVFGKRWWWIRTLVVALFWGLHLGIFFTMKIGLFPWICLAMWTIFLPGPLWDKVLACLRKKHYGSLTVYFDGDCRFCEKGVRLLREFFLLPEVQIKECQSDTKVLKKMESENSWVVMNAQGEMFTRFGAFLELLRHSPLFSWLRRPLGMRPLRWAGNRTYHWVSHHRPFMGKVTQYLVFTEEKMRPLTLKVLSEAFGGLIFATLIAWNLGTIKTLGIKTGYFGDVGRWLHIYQEWNMFAPFPKLDNVWIEVTGELSDGTSIDLHTGSRDIFGVRDWSFYNYVPNEHWRKFYLNLSNRSDYTRYYGGYLCRRWNDRNIRFVPETTLRKLEIVSFSQLNHLNNEKGPVERKLSWKHWCFDEDYKRDNPDSLNKRP